MNTFEACKTIRHLLLATTAEVMVYQCAEFSAKEIKQMQREVLKKYGTLNIADLTDEQCNDLGFGRFKDGDPLRLIPLWIYPFLSDDFVMTCAFNRTTITKRDNQDRDNRFGFMALGIIPASQ